MGLFRLIFSSDTEKPVRCCDTPNWQQNPKMLTSIGALQYNPSQKVKQRNKKEAEMIEVPSLVPVRKLAELVPGTTANFWYQRSRFGLIPGQIKCGRYVVIDLDIFFAALRDGKVGELKMVAA